MPITIRNQFRNKLIGMINYTMPEVVKTDPQDWYVYFRFLDPATGKWERIKKRCGINKYKDLKVRAAHAEALCIARKKWLEAGWNPITNTFPEIQTAHLKLDRLRVMTVLQAMQHAFDSKFNEWSKTTKRNYTTLFNFCKQGALSSGIGEMPVKDAIALHYRTLIETTIQARGLGNKGFNKYRDFMSTLIGFISSEEIIMYNPVLKIKPKAVVKEKAHVAPTDEEKQKIITEIKAKHWTYYRFFAVLYGCTLRPQEITRLKIKNLNFEKQEFTIIPDGEGASKTNFIRTVAVPDWVMDLLKELDLEQYDPEWYIFSTYANRWKYFVPGPRMMHEGTPTKYYKRVVKDVLGITVTQYAFKKLSGNDMVKLMYSEKATGLLDMAQMQMGHMDAKTTEIYTQEHQKIMREIVKRKMPGLDNI